MKFYDNVEDPSYFPTPLPDCLYHISFRRYRPLNLPLNCEIVQQRWFLEGKGYPRFWTCISNYIYFPPCGRIWFSSVRRAHRLEGEKKKKERRIPDKI